MQITSLNLSEEAKKLLSVGVSERIFRIIGGRLKNELEFIGDYAVAKLELTAERCLREGYDDEAEYYTTYGIVNKDRDLVFLNNDFFQLERNVKSIEIIGDYFLANKQVNGRDEISSVLKKLNKENNCLDCIIASTKPIKKTHNSDIIIFYKENKEYLFSLSKEKIISKGYSKIEDLGNGKFLITDEITSTISNELGGFTDKFIFAIDVNDEICSAIYSHLEQQEYDILGFIPTEYDKIRQKRFDELNEACEREERRIQNTKRLFMS